MSTGTIICNNILASTLQASTRLKVDDIIDINNASSSSTNLQVEIKQDINLNLTGDNFDTSKITYKGNSIETEIDLTGLNLTGADLSSRILRKADLTDAVLKDANLTGTDLTNANLTNANLTNANLTNVTLTNANLTNAKTSGIIGTPSSFPSTRYRLVNQNIAGPSVDLTGADLKDTNLGYLKLTDANLTGADLTNVAAIAANLTNANLIGAHLTNAITSHIIGTPVHLPSGYSLSTGTGPNGTNQIIKD